MEEGQRPRKLQKTDDGSAIAPHEGQHTPIVSTGPQNEETNEPQNEGSAGESGQVGEAEDGKAEGISESPAISKNQLKKIRRREQWEAGREFRKNKRKEKERVKRERERALKAEQAQNVAENGGDTEVSAQSSRHTSQKPNRGPSVTLPITFILDCDFDDLMNRKEVVSLSSQLTRCYSDNTNAHYRARLAITSFNKRLKERFDTALAKHYEKWKGITFTDEDFTSAAEKAHSRMVGSTNGGELMGAFANQKDAPSTPEGGEVIYLTSDSPDTLTELKPYHTYVIGGLVDRNRHKGVCYKKAMDKGVRTARLPIGDYMQMASRFVLTTNHVVDIMLKWLEHGDWAKAFELVIPKRKGGKLKGKEEEAVEEVEEADDSTAEIYGTRENNPVTEESPGSPGVPPAEAS